MRKLYHQTCEEISRVSQGPRDSWRIPRPTRWRSWTSSTPITSGSEPTACRRGPSASSRGARARCGFTVGILAHQDARATFSVKDEKLGSKEMILREVDSPVAGPDLSRDARPNELWVTEIAEFKVPSDMKSHPSPVIKSFNGRPVACSIGARPTQAMPTHRSRRSARRWRPTRSQPPTSTRDEHCR